MGHAARHGRGSSNLEGVQRGKEHAAVADSVVGTHGRRPAGTALLVLWTPCETIAGPSLWEKLVLAHGPYGPFRAGSGGLRGLPSSGRFLRGAGDQVERRQGTHVATRLPRRRPLRINAELRQQLGEALDHD